MLVDAQVVTEKYAEEGSHDIEDLVEVLALLEAYASNERQAHGYEGNWRSQSNAQDLREEVQRWIKHRSHCLRMMERSL